MSAKGKTLSRLFLAAAGKLRHRRYPAICDAIGACKTFPVELRATAKEVVKERLEPHLYYTRWVAANHPALYGKSFDENTLTKDKLEGRIAWCHALAEEFKDKS